VLVDEAAGAVASPAPADLRGTAAYLVPPPRGRLVAALAALRSLAAACQGGAGPSDESGAWLPLWRWDGAIGRVTVWDDRESSISSRLSSSLSDSGSSSRSSISSSLGSGGGSGGEGETSCIVGSRCPAAAEERQQSGCGPACDGRPNSTHEAPRAFASRAASCGAPSRAAAIAVVIAQLRAQATEAALTVPGAAVPPPLSPPLPATLLAPASSEAAPWRVPAGVELRTAPAAGGRVVYHSAPRPNTGLSRAFLWWMWGQEGRGGEGLGRLLARPEPLPQPGPRRPRLPALGGPLLDGLFATALDEALLRRDPLLRSHWNARRRLDTAGVRAVASEDAGAGPTQVRPRVFAGQQRGTSGHRGCPCRMCTSSAARPRF
jgi:hypothetical protein